MTYDSPQVVMGAQIGQVGLSEEDMASIRSATQDLGDIDSKSMERYQIGFRQAYHAAHLVATGEKDPQTR